LRKRDATVISRSTFEDSAFFFFLSPHKNVKVIS
jgi:hypothetical protein